MQRRWWMRVLTACAVVVISGALVRADPGKRSQLVGEIERLLSDIAGELRDVPGDSSTSDLERTLEYAGRVADKAREVRDHIDGDSDARRIAEGYPDIARRYQDAARYLRELKIDHRRLDEFPRRCEDAMKELASRMRAYTDSHDPRGAEEVPKLAREFGRVGKTALEQGDGVKRMTYERYDRVNNFSDSEGKWSDVRSQLHGAGRAMYEHTARMHEQVKRDDICGNLAKEERNPLVEQAMQKLLEGKRGIEMIYDSIDRQLSEMASNLDGLASDSDDSDIRGAERKADDIEKLLEQLDRIKGNDGEARRRLETGKNLVRAVREAMRHLRTLKQSQFLSDRAPEKCRDASSALREFIRGFLDKRRTEGTRQIPLRARALGEPIKVGLAKTDEHHPQMERALSEVQRFDPSEGRWREVKDKLRASASAIFDHWKKAREAAHTECNELAKGDQNKEVVAAVADLGKVRSDGETQLLRLQSEHRTWYDGLRELREWYKQDTKNVRDLFCQIPESPGDYAEGDAYAAQLVQIADRMRARLAPRWSQLVSEAARLQAIARKLMQEEDDDVSKGATRLNDEINKTMSSISNLLNNELHGANDPEFRARMETGKNEHKRIQADSSKCTKNELTFGSRRVDCIRVDGNTCYVVEIKPNNSEAIRRGRDQAIDGITKIKQALRGKTKKSELTDNLEVVRACFDESSQSANLKEELRVYEYCPPEGELYKDFVVP